MSITDDRGNLRGFVYDVTSGRLREVTALVSG